MAQVLLKNFYQKEFFLGTTVFIDC